MKKIKINSKNLLKPMKLDDIISLSVYDEIEIDITDTKELFNQPLSEIFSLKNFIRNIEIINITSSFKRKDLRVIWSIEINETDNLKRITELAKKHSIFGISIKWKEKKLDIKRIEENLGTKVASFVKNFYQDVMNMGVFLRFVEKTN